MWPHRVGLTVTVVSLFHKWQGSGEIRQSSDLARTRTPGCLPESPSPQLPFPHPTHTHNTKKMWSCTPSEGSDDTDWSWTLRWWHPGKAFSTVRRAVPLGAGLESPPLHLLRMGRHHWLWLVCFHASLFHLCFSRAGMLSYPSVFTSPASSAGHTPTPCTLETGMTTTRNPLEGHSVQRVQLNLLHAIKIIGANLKCDG